WTHRGHSYERLGHWDKAIADHAKAIDLLPTKEKQPTLMEKGKTFDLFRLFPYVHGPKAAVAHNHLAWLLATCPEAKYRDPKRAVGLAPTAVLIAPKLGAAWNTVGVANYRAGDYPAAVKALIRSMELSQGGDSHDWFFLAMAH